MRIMPSDKTLKKVLKLLKEYETTVSMVMGGLVVVISVFLLLSVIRSGKKTEPIGEATPTVMAQEITGTPDLKIVNETAVPAATETSLLKKAGSFIMRLFQPNTESETTVLETEVTPETYTLKLYKQSDGSIVTRQLPKAHKVVKGDNLWKIAEKYYGSGYNWVDIDSSNQLNQANKIIEGQSLSLPDVKVRVPKNGKLLVEVTTEATPVSSLVGEVKLGNYTVVKGDCLWSIAVKVYQDGFKWTQIWEANKDQIKAPQMIEVGWVLRIP